MPTSSMGAFWWKYVKMKELGLTGGHTLAAPSGSTIVFSMGMIVDLYIVQLIEIYNGAGPVTLNLNDFVTIPLIDISVLKFQKMSPLFKVKGTHGPIFVFLESPLHTYEF